MISNEKKRADIALVERGLLRSRSQAHDAVKRGLVRIDGVPVKKAAQLVGDNNKLELLDDAGRYVSRGAFKLAAALDAFHFDPSGRHCLDIGASTGGFTQILLERGAASVTAIDVGHGQMHDDVSSDSRVLNLEGTDARNISRDLIKMPLNAIAADVSFVSVTKVLGPALRLAKSGAWLAVLVKPQFELEPKALGKGGIVRSEVDRASAVDAVRDWLQQQSGWTIQGTVPSPISGQHGNQEFLLGALYEPSRRST